MTATPLPQTAPSTHTLGQANDLMVAALALLDGERHHAAAKLDAAIVELGIRPEGEGMPPG